MQIESYWTVHKLSRVILLPKYWKAYWYSGTSINLILWMILRIWAISQYVHVQLKSIRPSATHDWTRRNFIYVLQTTATWLYLHFARLKSVSLSKQISICSQNWSLKHRNWRWVIKIVDDGWSVLKRTVSFKSKKTK